MQVYVANIESPVYVSYRYDYPIEHINNLINENLYGYRLKESYDEIYSNFHQQVPNQHELTTSSFNIPLNSYTTESNIQSTPSESVTELGHTESSTNTEVSVLPQHLFSTKMELQ